MDYILKSSGEKVVINDFVQGDPLSEENLDRTLELVSNLRKVDSANPCKMGIPEDKNADKIRLLCPKKTIWIYSGYEWEHIFDDSYHYHPQTAEKLLTWRSKRQEIIKLCDVFIDGQYIDSQRDVSLRWKGSKNQRVIDCKESLKQNKIILYCE